MVERKVRRVAAAAVFLIAVVRTSSDPCPGRWYATTEVPKASYIEGPYAGWIPKTSCYLGWLAVAMSHE